MSFSNLSDRLTRAVMGHLQDDLADYTGATMASQVPVILDRDFEVMDEDQVAMRVTTISVQVIDVATSRQGDSIHLGGRTWTVQQILEDDGFIRRLWVS
ncbi:head-tail joining protein [Halomonas sp.]|uniref:head-tail joining protein n=1 Tax=Halomonas sp. TaxID=1486246 RepID=UPI003D0B5FFF